MHSWDELEAVEQAVLTLASEEGLLWEVRDYWPPSRDVYTVPEAERIRYVVGGMMREGLLWIFWLGAEARDLTEAEVVKVFNDSTWWMPGGAGSRSAALCLTERGEQIYCGHTR